MYLKPIVMLSNKEKQALKCMAMEAYEILDDINSFGVFCSIKNGNNMVSIDEQIYNRLLHLLRLVERAHVEQSLDWFEYGQIPSFSPAIILKEFNS